MPDFNKLMIKLLDEEQLSSFGFITSDICKNILLNVTYNIGKHFNDLSNIQQNNVLQLYDELLL